MVVDDSDGMVCNDCDCINTEDWEALMAKQEEQEYRIANLEDTVESLINILVEIGAIEVEEDE